MSVGFQVQPLVSSEGHVQPDVQETSTMQDAKGNDNTEHQPTAKKKEIAAARYEQFCLPDYLRGPINPMLLEDVVDTRDPTYTERKFYSHGTIEL